MLDFRMPFGKFKGQLICDLPPDYLIQLHEKANLRQPLATHVAHHYEDLMNADSVFETIGGNTQSGNGRELWSWCYYVKGMNCPSIFFVRSSQSAELNHQAWKIVDQWHDWQDEFAFGMPS
ncbi:MAG: DUF3820 family protein [Planctomycetota bacterium]